MTQPHRILYVLDRYPELSQTFVRMEIEELQRQGIHVEVLAAKRGNDAVPLHKSQRAWFLESLAKPRPAVFAHLWWLLIHPSRYAVFLWRLLRLRGQHGRLAVLALPLLARRMESENLDRVHAHFAKNAAALAAYVAALLQRPFSITVHAKDIYCPQRNARLKLAMADVVITVCDYNVTWMREHNFKASRLLVVPCGVEVPHQAAARLENALDIVVVARLVQKKGLDVLVEALGLLKQQGLEPESRIIGDGPERDALERAVRDRGLGGFVQFMGAVDHPVALEQIGRARVFCLPCRYAPDGDSDAFPVVLREAMARGVAVVTTAIAGIPESVDSDVGWVVEPEDPLALALALKEAYTNPSEARRRGRVAQARVEESFTLNATVTQLRAAWSSKSNV